jgi:hypothetical protein
MDQIDRAIAEFPKTFGLRAFPGDRFAINRSASFESPRGSGRIMLYVFTAEGKAFCKGSPNELRSEIINPLW